MKGDDSKAKIASLKQLLRLERKKVEDLLQRLADVGMGETIPRGREVEHRIAKKIGGKVTEGNAGHDIELKHEGRIIRVEVKFSRLHQPNKGRKVKTKRWSWGSIRGSHGSKRYDWLLLVGEADTSFRGHCHGRDSVFIFFLVDWKCAKNLGYGSSRGLVHCCTNPEAARRGSYSWYLFHEGKDERGFQVTEDELRLKVRSPNQRRS